MIPTGYHNCMSLPNSHQQDGQKHINYICKKVLNAMYLKMEILTFLHQTTEPAQVWLLHVVASGLVTPLADKIQTLIGNVP